MGRADVVTGATRGLGRGIARGFAQPENTVVITGRDEIALLMRARKSSNGGQRPFRSVAIIATMRR